MNVNEVETRPTDLMGQIHPEALDEKAALGQQHANAETRSAASSEEKKGPYVDEKEDELQEGVQTDPFVPFDDLPEERERIITIRAVLLGCVCGAAVNASNIYLGLKTGWTFSANLFGAIVGFTVLKSLAKVLPENFPILGGSFGPRENNIVQTAATAAGGLSSVFISGIPALYQLNLLDTPQKDFTRLITLTICGGYFGFSFSTPLRKFFIIYVARELRLIFPTPLATALSIRSMHAAATGEAVAKMKMKALSISFSGAFILRVVSQYATGILWDWHIFTWFFIWGKYNNKAIYVENWGWIVEWTPAFIGSGMIIGLNTAISFFGGEVLAWGIIGPALVKNGAAFGTQASDDPKWAEYISYASLSTKFTTKDHPSPRYWLLWPGVLLMIVVSFVELALQYRVAVHAGRAIGRGTAQGIAAGCRAMNKRSEFWERKAAIDANDNSMAEDSALESELVKWWMWFPILVLVIICTCVVMGVQFGMPVGETLLAIFLAFFFSFLAIQCAGVTDVTPLTAASKASQIVLGGATKGEHWSTTHAQQLNLLGGCIASMGANQASDLTSDFRVGFLLRTPPNQQWLAQGLGTIVAVFLAPAMFILFAKAYPCIIDVEAETCAFAGPSIAAWRAVAVAVTSPTLPIPTSSGIFAIVLAIFGGMTVIWRHYAYRGTWEKYRVYHPNMMCVGLAFTLPQTQYGTAALMGALLSHFWGKKNPKHFDIYGYAVATGFIAGEGIGGVVNAIFQIAGISGPEPYGTNAGCPADAC